MDVLALKNYIIENPDTIHQLLDDAGFHHINKVKTKSNEIRCAKDIDGNPTSVQINIENLYSRCYSSNTKGDLITLLQSKLGTTFPQTIRWIKNKLGLSEEQIKAKEIKLPFYGYFKEIKRQIDNYSPIKTYDEKILDNYGVIPNRRFLKDNISCVTQEKFGIGYDVLTNRITIAWHNSNGELVGIMGRLHKDELEDNEQKYLPVLSFKKESLLYGYHINYNTIIENNLAIIVESEKSVMQLDSMGIQIGLGLGGNSITESRARMVKSLGISNVILAYDEGLDLEFIIENAKKLKMNNAFYKNRVGYVCDVMGDILPKGSKLSPTDLGKEKLQKLLNDYVVWI